MQNGVYVRLCDATQQMYNHAHALKRNGSSADGSDSDSERDGMPSLDGEENQVSDEEPERERTEDDMELNELSELWGWHFDFGRPNAVLPLEGLIEYIVKDDEAKRVCAAVRVLNRAVRGSKPDDPADAEKLLQWKEELVADYAIRACGEILEKVDGRGFHDPCREDEWMYMAICSEIMELFERLGTGDALYRTKMRRNGALKGVQTYTKEHPNSSDAQALLDMLRQR